MAMAALVAEPRVGSIQAWLLDESPGGYRYGEVDLPGPGPGEVWVRVAASALNHLDLWLRQGLPKPPMFPMVPGGDGAGTVDAVGEGVTRWQVGDEVVVNPSFACGRCDQCLADRSVFCPKWGIMGEHYQGAHGELVVVREANLVAKPPSISWETAAAYGLCGLTVYRMLRRARLVAGETLLVVGAGGGVGSAALALGQRMGAQVYVTSRDPAKRAHAIELGALGAFPSDEKIPLKADVVVDTAGSPTWALSMGALSSRWPARDLRGDRRRARGGQPAPAVLRPVRDHGLDDGHVPRVRRAHEARRRWFARPGGQRLPPRRLPARPRPPGGRRPVRQGRPPPPVGAPAPVETAS